MTRSRKTGKSIDSPRLVTHRLSHPARPSPARYRSSCGQADNKAQIVGNEEGSAAGAPPDRVLLDTDEVASGPRHFSSKIEEIRDLNGGLWGPNEEEELEIKNELAYDDKMFEPKNNLYDFFLGLDADSLFEDEDDDISFSFSFDFDFDFQ